MMKEVNNEFNSQKERREFEEKDLYGIKPEVSLQSVNFATTETPHLNEHFQDE